MRRTECPRESDAFTAASLGQWPDRSADDLRAHVGTCAICAEVIAVTLALQGDRREAVRNPSIPPAELVWWRLERRAREEAACAAARPILLVHVAAVATGVGGLLVLAGAVLGGLRAWTDGLAALLSGLPAAVRNLPDLATLAPWALPLAVGIGPGWFGAGGALSHRRRRLSASGPGNPEGSPYRGTRWPRQEGRPTRGA